MNPQAQNISDNVITLKSVECDLCQKNSNKLLYKMPDLRFKSFKQEYSVVECLSCGHRFLSPQPTAESLKWFYSEDYYQGRQSTDIKQQQRYLRQAEYLPPIKNGRILDVGCAGGAWLKVIQQNGWQCYGVDLFESSQKETGIDIRYGDLSEVDFPASSFDVVCAWGAMEHVRKPSDYFKAIHNLLKEKGQFVFMITNGDSLWSRWAYGEDIPRHLHFFRKRTLPLYAKKFGYTVRKIEPTNNIYSRPATGRGLFRRRLLRLASAPWKDIVTNPQKKSLKLLAKFGSLLDYCLIHPKLEEKLGICGNMVVIFEKS